MSEQTSVRPAEFARQLLQAMEASEGRRKRRKRDTTPDAIGMSIQRDLLERAIADDPEPDAFEEWLLNEVLTNPASGPIRAMAVQIFDQYRLIRHDANFREWLEAGAPSADAGTDV
jgi:hypothetical protein